MLLPLGLRLASVSSSSTVSRGTGVGRNARTERRVRMRFFGAEAFALHLARAWGLTTLSVCPYNMPMTSKTVNTRPLQAPAGLRPASRYSTLARLLTEEIAAGRYKVGDKIPTEAELQQRFDVSRHTVREALRELKDRAWSSRAPASAPWCAPRRPTAASCRASGTLRELIQFVEATRMRVLKRREVIADEDARRAARVQARPAVARGLGVALPAEASDPGRRSMSIYVRPEHADVLDRIDTRGPAGLQPDRAPPRRAHRRGVPADRRA